MFDLITLYLRIVQMCIIRQKKNENLKFPKNLLLNVLLIWIKRYESFYWTFRKCFVFFKIFHACYPQSKFFKVCFSIRTLIWDVNKTSEALRTPLEVRKREKKISTARKTRRYSDKKSPPQRHLVRRVALS